MSQLNIPVSNATVRVRMVDTSAVMVVNSKSFIEPVQTGHETLNLYVAAFLLDHPPSGREIMFDLGVRKDYWKLPAALQKRLGTVIPALRVDSDTTDILQEQGIALKDISSVIWSHYHWDHTGSMELFPASTELVVGPGFKTSPNLLPGFPQNPDSPIDSAALEGRFLREIEFDKTTLKIGGFRAYDLFEDGSFYLLDTPGHCLGHMCGLARTTGGSESTFVLLGGDICHFPGVFRPNEGCALPDFVPKDLLDKDPYFPVPCPCSLFSDNHPTVKDSKEGDNEARKEGDSEARTTPFYKVSKDSTAAYMNPVVSQQSVDKLLRFDASTSVLVCLAHDETMLRTLPTLNTHPKDDLNDWQKRGFKEKIKWGWLNDLPRNGEPGRALAVEGFWRDGKPWPEARDVLKHNGKGASRVTL